jgi:outer membrane lipoprotein-sorting protein
MLKRWPLALGLLALCGTLVAQGLPTVEQTISQGIECLSSVRADIQTKVFIKRGETAIETVSKGDYAWKRHGDNVLLRIETDAVTTRNQSGSAPQTTTSKRLLLQDGSFQYNVKTKGNRTNASKIEAPQPRMLPTFAELRADNDVVQLPDSTVDGQACYVIEARPKDPQGTTQRWYCHKQTGFPLKTERLDASGVPTVVTTYTNVRFNTALDPQLFVFEPPKNVPIEDLSN